MSTANNPAPGGGSAVEFLAPLVCLLGCIVAGLTALIGAWNALGTHESPGGVALYLFAAVAAFGLPLVVFGRRV